MGSVLEAADGAPLLAADALLLVDLVRVVNQALHVGVATVVVGRGAPPGRQAAEVGIAARSPAVARGPSVESMGIRAAGACRPSGGSLELQSTLGADAVDQDLPFGVVRDVPSARAEWTGVVDRMPVVEASVGADVGFIVVEGRLGSIGGVASPIVGQGRDGVSVAVGCALQILGEPALTSNLNDLVVVALVAHWCRASTDGV